jgi:hypothetical protein
MNPRGSAEVKFGRAFSFRTVLTLINTNTMLPAVGPLGLDYIAGHTTEAGVKTDILDLCLSTDPLEAMKEYFSAHSPHLVGLSFRNVDDSEA